jgi:DNA-binding transcriptional LysR family regulator
MDRLQSMVAFVRVVETGSFSGAARQLGVGQPAVSKTIAQLEDRLQVRLLVRSTHALSPTDAGVRFYERAKLAIREVDEAELEARGAGAGLTGRLRLSAATTFTRLLIVPRLPEFLAAHPSLDMDLILDDRVIDLVSEGMDMALRMGALADSTAVARKIASGRRSVVATARLPRPSGNAENAGRPAPPPRAGLQPARRCLDVREGWRGNLRHRPRTAPGQRGGGGSRGGAGGYGTGGRVRLDVRARAGERRRTTAAARLDPAAAGSVGPFPNRADGQRQGPRLRQFRGRRLG